MSNKELDIAIIGGGIAGLTLAIALHSRNVPVHIYEQASAFGEIGAGVSFSPNAIVAMKICHSSIHDAFERVCTRNLWQSKQKVWFDYLNGYGDNGLTKSGHQDAAFTISNSIGQNGVHRAAFLDEVVKLIPRELSSFGKRLKGINEADDGKLVMTFEDGSQAKADAVIGCDGIKSKVRQVMFPDRPTHPTFTHKYAYRGLVPMEKAVEAIGEERAQNSCMHMGQDSHVLTFPVNQGRTLNIVGFHTTTEDWSYSEKLTRPGKKLEALRDYEGFGPNVIELLNLCNEDLDVWAIFDLAEHRVPAFSKGRTCLAGDAAHATSPHHGAGAGFCIEDAAMLAELIADVRVQSVGDIDSAFTIYDDFRRERGQWLVESSRFIGDCYEWRAAGIDKDFKKIETEINRRNGIIGDFDVVESCRKARAKLDADNTQHKGQGNGVFG